MNRFFEKNEKKKNRMMLFLSEEGLEKVLKGESHIHRHNTFTTTLLHQFIADIHWKNGSLKKITSKLKNVI